MKSSPVAESYELYCFEQGQGEPVVMVHGLVSTHRYMQGVYELLPKNKYHVFAPDLLGMGESPRPKARQNYACQCLKSVKPTNSLSAK